MPFSEGAGSSVRFPKQDATGAWLSGNDTSARLVVANLRIKRDAAYGHFQLFLNPCLNFRASGPVRQSEPTVDASAKALDRFEVYTKYRDFGAFHPEQAIAFKRYLAEQKGQRSGKELSKATLPLTHSVSSLVACHSKRAKDFGFSILSEILLAKDIKPLREGLPSPGLWLHVYSA